MRFKFLVGDETSLYAVKPTGELLWFPTPDPSSVDPDAPPGPNLGLQIGHGWDEFSQLIAGGSGTLYAIRPNGDLLWYRDQLAFPLAASPGTDRWHPNSGRRIGNGWDRFVQVVSGGDGILYGLEASGDLYWYRDLNNNGIANWDSQSGNCIGIGWNIFSRIAGGTNGVLYGIKPTGTLHWYRDIFRNGANAHDGSNGWANGSGNQIGFDWQYFTHVFAGGSGVLMGSRCREECGELLWYRDDRQDGSNSPDGSAGWSTLSGTVVAARYEISPVEGYCWPISAEPGQDIEFFMSAMEGSVLSVGYVALREQGDGTYGEFFQGSLSLSVGGHYQVSADDAWQQGCGWNPSFKLTIPSGWPSGLYAARCTTAQGFAYQIPFIVKPRSNEAAGNFLMIANTNTWTAYNRWSGQSNYTLAGPCTLSYLRPNNHLLSGPRDHANGNHLLRGEIWVLDWLHREGYKVDVCSDLDWAAGSVQASRYRGLILQTHPEYWSTGMRDSLAQYLSRGMNLIHIGGNAIFRAVSNPANSQGIELPVVGPQISTSQDGTEQYLNDGGKVRSLVGTQFNWGVPSSVPYTVNPAQSGHWVFKGVPGFGVAGEAGTIGGPGRLGNAACGWEVDTARLGNATAADPDFSPANTALLASGPSEVSDKFYPASPTDKDATGHMVCFTTAAGGFVFSAPSITFGASLAEDPSLQILMRNVLGYSIGQQYVRPVDTGHLAAELETAEAAAGGISEPHPRRMY